MTLPSSPSPTIRGRAGAAALAFGLLLIAAATLAALMLIDRLQHEPSTRGSEDWSRWSASAALLGGLTLLGGSIRLLRTAPADPAPPPAPARAPARIGAAYTRRRRFVVADPDFCALLGWPAGALDGRPVAEFLAAIDPGGAALDTL
ncbi:MAG: hypothetical protein KGL18_07705, partial [Burkholderiales bacterium]|nr:hypothetical protein [Burkholderiales bacterium]